jgi:CubicO group peptidase (beta-lactamase class C family)
MRVTRFWLTFPLALVLLVGVPVSTEPGSGQAAVATATLPDGIALSPAESVGFSGDSLKQLDTAMQGIVDAKQLAGVVTLVARHGKVVQHKAYGVQDVATQTPMQLDTIVRVYSMTKPIAGAAMMML